MRNTDSELVEVPAGNGNVHRCRTPWGRSNAIIVGASDRWDEMAYYSNVGSCITLFAPGSGVESTWVEQDPRETDPTFKIRTLWGTGPAAAHVAGLLAYLQSLQPEYLSPADLKSLLLKYALKDVLKKIPEDTTNVSCDKFKSRVTNGRLQLTSSSCLPSTILTDQVMIELLAVQPEIRDVMENIGSLSI